MVNLILSCIALVVFLVYNIVSWCLFSSLPSLSDTFYYYNEKKENLGYVFTGMMFMVALTLLLAWINITENISSWSHNLTVLPFLGASCIAFVGAAPAFKGVRLENRVHTIAAIMSAVVSVLWIVIVCWKIMYVIPIWFLIIGGIAHATKTARSCRYYWFEMVAFGSTFSAIIIESIILLG